MTFLQQIDHLRRLAQLDPETTVFDLALVGVLEDMAVALDRLAGGDEPRGFGSI